MTDYKHTLNLPHTLFSMKANLNEREPLMLKRWEEEMLYEKIREKRANSPLYILHDGPPYANGHIHLGHAVNKILKDIILKAKGLSGFNAPFVPGWDCHGLPIELNVEKSLSAEGNTVTPAVFREHCRAYAFEQVTIQREEFKRLGILGDWENPYLTMNFGYEAQIIRALSAVINKGNLQQGLKPVYWCVNCGSALAEAEVEYSSKISRTADVRFRLVNDEALLSRIPQAQGMGTFAIPIWTTTLWTLPANEAIALNPESNYVIIQTEKERLLLAEDRYVACLQSYGMDDYKILTRVKGKVLEGLLLQHPFYTREVPIILGDHVTMDTGTGAVHTAPSHGEEDYVVSLLYHLPVVSPVNGKGYYGTDTTLFAGEHVFKVDEHILKELEAHENLLLEKKIEHSYPHCWRHKTPLIFRATPQWFIGMDREELRSKTLDAIHFVNWWPRWGENRMETMITGRPDWCVSRQRVWGVPMPLFIHQTTRALHPRTIEFLEIIAKDVEKHGVEAWYTLDPRKILGTDADVYEKITDTLDVWFDSGVSHYAVLKERPELRFPADLYLEGSDQHRGWFQTSLLTSMVIEGEAPYKNVITHGFAVDEKGRKMSKSLGNVTAPDKVIKALGADILRLWIASTDYTSEMTVSDEILKRTAEAYRRLRNTVRFLLANLHDLNPNNDLVAPERMLSLDRFILERARLLQMEIREGYDKFEFHTVYQKLHNFCINELGGFYLDIIKDRQYTLQRESLARRSAQTALYHIAEAMVRWLAPLISFTAEEIWHYLPGERPASVFLMEWYDLKFTHEKDYLSEVYEYLPQQEYWNLLLKVRSLVNKEIEKLRIAGIIGAALETEVELYCSSTSRVGKVLSALVNELRFVFITSAAQVLFDPAPAESFIEIIDQEKLGIKIKAIAGLKKKCVRCWHRCSDVGEEANYQELCLRCISNLPSGKGEARFYA